MPQLISHILDAAVPNTQDAPLSVPVIWTAGRIYSFANLTSFVVTDSALVYKSVDGGVNWTAPNSASASRADGGASYFQDGSTETVNILFLQRSFGSQPLRLQNFDMDAETFAAPFGTASPPTQVWFNTVGVYRTADGTLFCFANKNTGGGAGDNHATLFLFQSGAWQPEVLFSGGASQWNTSIVDFANNLCHVFWQEGSSFKYCQITSAGVISAVTTFSAGFNLSPPRLQFNCCFSNGYINAAGDISIPAFSTSGGLISLNNIIGSPASAPVFTQSPAIDTAGGAGFGQDPGAAVSFTKAGVDYIAYFIGDGSGNLYNLIKLATNSGSGWTVQQIYDATLDPNALANPNNQQWINTISAAPATVGLAQYQFSVWHLYGGTDDNTTIFSSAASATPPTISCGNPPAGQLSVPYSHTVTASGGTIPYVFSLTGGALPLGLTLSAAGVISGSPAATGTFTFTVTVTDANLATASVDCSIFINVVTFTGLVGGMGCVPHCVDPCKEVSQVDRVGGGDPLLLALILAAGVVMGAA
jgi:Putative Ig domain